MMTAAVVWPCDALMPTTHTMPYAEFSTKTGGRSEGGMARYRQRDPFWRMKYQTTLRRAPDVQLVQAILAQIAGRDIALSFPIYGCGRGPGAVDFRLTTGWLPFSDEEGFSDGVGFMDEVYPASLAAAAALRATQISIAVAYEPDRLLPGHYLTINGRLNQIKSIVSVDGLTAVVNLVTPLREAVPSGTAITFDRPRGLFRIENPDAFAIQLEGNRFGSLSFDLIEYI